MFSISSKKTNRRRSACIPCLYSINKSYRQNHKQYFIDKGAEYYENNKTKRKADSKRQKLINPEASRIRRQRIGRSQQLINYENKWRKENQIRIKQWYADNRDVVNAIAAKRRATKLQATPSWLSKEQLAEIQEFYTLAQELAWLNQDGKCFHVDHIIPLQGEDVCGLHVPWNLQLLPAIDNIKKSNKI